MKEVEFDDIPAGCQFIMTWEHNNLPWATTLVMGEHQNVMEYVPSIDGYNDAVYSSIINGKASVRFFVIDSSALVRDNEDPIAKYNRAMGIIK